MQLGNYYYQEILSLFHIDELYLSDFLNATMAAMFNYSKFVYEWQVSHIIYYRRRQSVVVLCNSK